MSMMNDPRIQAEFEKNLLKPLKETVSRAVGLAMTEPDERADVLDALDYLTAKFHEMIKVIALGKELVLNNLPKEPANV